MSFQRITTSGSIRSSSKRPPIARRVAASPSSSSRLISAISGAEPAALKKGITKQQALQLLQQDAAKAGAAVKACVKVPLTQSQFDALVSFTFNCGVGAFESSTLLKRLNAGDYGAVPTELRKWVKAGPVTLPGLVTRRTAEGTLFSKGSY